jgi:hypothetical protein
MTGFSVHAWRVDKGEGSDRAALPGIAHAEYTAPAAQLECNGEIFELRPDKFGGTHYTWLGGPNPGYGFSVSPAADDIEEHHQTNIRSFLLMIDPSTGYVEED